MSQQVKSRLSAIRDFLAGRSGEAKAVATEDKATREVVAAELLATLSGRCAEEAADVGVGEAGSDTQEIARFDAGASSGEMRQPKHDENSKQHDQERERARTLFLEHGYFDEAVQNLRAGNSAGERAAAARVLGLVGSQRGTAHLIAAMFDDAPEVRGAAEEALNLIGDSPMRTVPLDAPLSSEIKGTSHAESKESKLDQQSGPGDDSPVETLEVGSAELELRQEQALGASGPGEVVGTGSAEVDVVEEGGPDVREAMNAASPISASNATENAVPAATADVAATSDLSSASERTVTAPLTTIEEGQLLAEQNRVIATVAQLQEQILETVALREESEREAARRTEREARLRVEAAARAKEEEEIRKRADEESERRRIEEREAVLAEQEARTRADVEAERLAEEETSLRVKAADLKRTVAELAQQRTDSETARLKAAEAAERAEATRARNEARLRHDAELDRLHKEEEDLRAKTEEIALRAAEIESARERAEAEAERLMEAQARIRTAEEARTRAEVERARLEAEIKQKVEKALQLLEDTRRRGQEEQERLEEEARRRAEAEQQRRAELESMKTRAEANSRQLAENEQQVLAQVNSLRIADAETRRRIADAEVRRRAAEDAYRVVAEIVQRVEAEAHARAKEEEQMRAKLEAERRTVAVEAQSRADQEKRVREEIEVFRRLEEQERPRIEEAILQRADAEARLQQLRQRLKGEEEAQVRAEEELSFSGNSQDILLAQRGVTEQEHADESLLTKTATGPDHARPLEAPPGALYEAAQKDVTVASDVHGGTSGPASVPPAITAYLNSVDPYKRAAAVAELARSRPQDAFELITNCFDDHSAHVRNAAARALRKLEPARTVDLFNRALEEASAERRRNIGGAIAASGVATEAIENLVSENREDTFSALSILFVMAKTGEVEPLNRALLEHPDDEIGKAVAKLLALSGHR